MKKVLFGLIILISACKKETIETELPKPKLFLKIDPLLPIDSNGYYHFKLYNRTPMGNNSHRISGQALVNDKPVSPEPLIVNFKSSHYGLLPKGWMIIKPTKSYINYFTGQWTTIVLPDIISNRDYFLPTITQSCYSDRNTGQINAIIEPTFEMRGDTMTVSARYVYRYVTKMNGYWETDWKLDSTFDTKKIILE